MKLPESRREKFLWYVVYPLVAIGSLFTVIYVIIFYSLGEPFGINELIGLISIVLIFSAFVAIAGWVFDSLLRKPSKQDTNLMGRNIPGRPTGITILSILEGVNGFYVLLSGIGQIVHLQWLRDWMSMYEYMEQQSIGNIHLMNGGITAKTSSEFTILLIVLGSIVITFTVIHFLLAYGFSRGKSWAWTLGIIFFVVGTIFSAIIYIISPELENLIITIPSVVIGAAIVIYLTRPHVKAYFGKA